MSKKKNLERAIVLGLILSTDGIGIDQFKGGAENSVITVNEDTIVNGTEDYGPDITVPDVGDNSLFNEKNENMTVTAGNVAGNVKLTFNRVNMISPHIVRAGGTNGADIVIDNTNPNTPGADGRYTGISVSAFIEGNSLTINSDGRGIYTGVGGNYSPVKINGNDYWDVHIKVNDAFHLDSYSYAVFNEGVNQGNVDITAGNVDIENQINNGVYNAGQDTDHGNDYYSYKW